MHIIESQASSVSLPEHAKRAGKASKNDVQMGKVIAKSGKEIEVLINDKVYKIEPGNYQTIKIGDTIQVFFGKNVPSEISAEMLQKISGKLIDVFSLSLPFQTTQELENIINHMPQGERLQFARISNEISSLVESILSEDYGLEIKESAEKLKNAFDLFDPRLPFNRRLIELSLKIKAMGNLWEQLPDNIKKEIVKEYVLFDLKSADKSHQDSGGKTIQLETPIKDDSFASLNNKQEELSKSIDIKSTLDQAKDIKLPESISELKPDKQINPQQSPVNKSDGFINEQVKNITPQKGQALLNLNQIDEQNQVPVEKKTLSPEIQSSLKGNLLINHQEKNNTLKQEAHTDLGKTQKTENQTQSKPLMKEGHIAQKDSQGIHTETLGKKTQAFEISNNYKPQSINKSYGFISEQVKNITPQKGQALLNLNQIDEQNQVPVEKKTLSPEIQSSLKGNLLINHQEKDNTLKQEEHTDLGKTQKTENQTQSKPLMKEGHIAQKDSQDIHTETLGKKTPVPALSKEEFARLTELLKNALSKPVSVEKSYPSLFKMNNTHDRVESLNQRLDQLSSNYFQINTQEKDILSALKDFINLPDKNNAINESMVLHGENYQAFLKGEITFENISQISLMKFEINRMINELQSNGVEKKDAFFFTNDMVNIASKTLNESNFSTQIYSSSIKKYLKYRLPQIIVDNKIEISSENKLIEKVELFSKKTFMIIKAHIEKLAHAFNNKPEQQKTVNQESSDNVSKKGLNSFAHTKEDSSQMKTSHPQEPIPGNDRQRELSRENTNTGTNTQKLELSEAANEKKTQSSLRNNENMKINDKQSKTDGSNTLQKSTMEKTVQEPKEVHTNTRQAQVHSKPNVEIYSEKMLKILNMPAEKQDFNPVYSSVIHLYEQNFSIDFQQQKLENSGYEKKEMYRVFIETNTQLFGTVFVDTVVSGKNLDIYIYADNSYAKEFTNHSSLLVKRLKETEYDLRSLLIRERIDHNEILKHKVKLYTNPSEKGGFFGLA